MRILIVMGGFFPGMKYGGPPVSIDNFCALMNEHDCYIVTTNHDLGDKKPYIDINNGWNKRKNYFVLYLSEKEYGMKRFEDIIQEIKPDLLYLQGLFQKCVLPCLILAKKYNLKVLLAPRGELCTGAFKKKYKKIPYIIFLRLSGLLNTVQFQATSDEEILEISDKLHVRKNRVHKLVNIPSLPELTDINLDKSRGSANFLYLSRIVPKKNLLYALNSLLGVQGNVYFDIYGPIEDKSYWNKCQDVINILPDNVLVRYCGIINHDKVHDTFRNYHAFVFPTFSENYGHVIAEALSVGCPVIISDQTPFTDVNDFGAGCAISLNNQNLFIKSVQKVIDMDKIHWYTMSTSAINYMKNKIDKAKLKKTYSYFFKVMKW